MKREIVCLKCKQEMQKLFGSYPGEHVKFMDGYIQRSSLICDNCGEELPRNVVVSCISIWSDHGRIPYYPWEGEYINPIA